MLKHEPGGHRIQRIPPTERNGRVHTSTVTVAVIPTDSTSSFQLKETDLEIVWFSGTGAGGQHRNKHQNSCRLKHLPTGIVVQAQCRSRQNSLDEARAEMLSRLTEQHQVGESRKESANRKQQVGSGMRGDKIRTYRFKDNVVTDHITGKVSKCLDVLKGNFDKLWS